MNDGSVSASGEYVEEIRVRHIGVPAIGHVDPERLERGRFEMTPDLLGGHESILLLLASAVKRGGGSRTSAQKCWLSGRDTSCRSVRTVRSLQIGSLSGLLLVVIS